MLEAAEREQVFVRRIYTNPAGDTLIGMDSRQRLFPAALATFLRLRDQRCATPFCDAPIRHVDHVRPHARGGPTSTANGQGLCARCNHVKDEHGFRSEGDPQSGITTLVTPTGHAYARTPPAVLGHPRLPVSSGPRFVVTNVRFVGGSAA